MHPRSQIRGRNGLPDARLARHRSSPTGYGPDLRRSAPLWSECVSGSALDPPASMNWRCEYVVNGTVRQGSAHAILRFKAGVATAPRRCNTRRCWVCAGVAAGRFRLENNWKCLGCISARRCFRASPSPTGRGVGERVRPERGGCCKCGPSPPAPLPTGEGRMRNPLPRRRGGVIATPNQVPGAGYSS
jgi:hypothetical protein